MSKRGREIRSHLGSKVHAAREWILFWGGVPAPERDENREEQRRRGMPHEERIVLGVDRGSNEALRMQRIKSLTPVRLVLALIFLFS